MPVPRRLPPRRPRRRADSSFFGQTPSATPSRTAGLHLEQQHVECHRKERSEAPQRTLLPAPSCCFLARASNCKTASCYTASQEREKAREAWAPEAERSRGRATHAALVLTTLSLAHARSFHSSPDTLTPALCPFSPLSPARFHACSHREHACACSLCLCEA